MFDLHWIPIMLVSLPFCTGMFAAFYRAKKGGNNYYNDEYSLKTNLLMDGYGAGNKFCILSVIVIVAVVTILNARGLPLLEFFKAGIMVIIGSGVVSMILGVILYLPCAYLGYTFRARELAEEEMARVQQQILKDAEAEKGSERT